MTVVKITGIPKKMNMKVLVNHLTKCIPDEFEYRGFDQDRCKLQKTKSTHIKLSPKADIAAVLKGIKEKAFSGGARLNAVVVNDNAVPFSNGEPKQAQRKCYKPSEVLPTVMTQIYNEIVWKYPRLIKLNVRYNYVLFDKLALILFERLKEVVKTGGKELLASALQLSTAYRVSHPHTGDLDTVRDVIAATRLEIEDPLASDDEEEHLSEKPFEEKKEMTHAQVTSICDKYTSQISTKMYDYIKQLDSEVLPGDNSEVVARKRVRREMKDMSTLLNAVLKQIVLKNVSHDFTPDMYGGMQIYGEPTLPPQRHMITLLQGLKATRISFSHVLFNKVEFSVPDFKHAAVMALNGKQIGIAKLRVVSRNAYTLPRYKHDIYNSIRDYCQKEFEPAEKVDVVKV